MLHAWRHAHLDHAGELLIGLTTCRRPFSHALSSAVCIPLRACACRLPLCDRFQKMHKHGVCCTLGAVHIWIMQESCSDWIDNVPLAFQPRSFQRNLHSTESHALRLPLFSLCDRFRNLEMHQHGLCCMKCISMVCAACLRGDRHVPVLAAYLFRSFDVCVSPAASAFNVPVVWVLV